MPRVLRVGQPSKRVGGPRPFPLYSHTHGPITVTATTSLTSPTLNQQKELATASSRLGGALCRPSERHGVNDDQQSRGVNDPGAGRKAWPDRPIVWVVHTTACASADRGRGAAIRADLRALWWRSDRRSQRNLKGGRSTITTPFLLA